MIFVTVGHQMPFDRLIQAVDQWAEQRTDAEVFAQIGHTKLRPSHLRYTAWLTPEEYEQQLDRCSAVVSHAGTGTIIQALIRRKPVLVLPRLHRLRETRNDHQVATAEHFADRGQILAASDQSEVVLLLDTLLKFRPKASVSSCASPELLQRISEFLSHCEGRQRETVEGCSR